MSQDDKPEITKGPAADVPQSTGADSPLQREAYVFGGALWDSVSKAAHDPMSLVKMAGGAALGAGLTVLQSRYRPIEAAIAALGFEGAITIGQSAIRNSSKVSDIWSRTWDSGDSLDADRKTTTAFTDDAVDFGLMGAPSMVAPAVRSAMLKPLWERSAGIPYFKNPPVPPSFAMSNAFDETAGSVGLVGATHTFPDGRFLPLSGSGFPLADDPRLFVTTSHLIENADTVNVFYWGDRKYAVDLLGVNQKRDLALLRLADDHPGIPIRGLKLSEADPEYGQSLLAMGFQGKNPQTGALGFRASLGRFSKVSSSGTDVLSMKAPGGFSGGPAINEAGEVQEMIIANKPTLWDRLMRQPGLSKHNGGNGSTQGIRSDEIREFVEANRNNPGVRLPSL